MSTKEEKKTATYVFLLTFRMKFSGGSTYFQTSVETDDSVLSVSEFKKASELAKQDSIDCGLTDVSSPILINSLQLKADL